MRRKIYSIITLLCLYGISDGQVTLYGLTSGPSNTDGHIIKFQSGSHNLSSIYSFRDVGNKPNQNSNLVHFDDGKFYGTTPLGGVSHLGVLFSFDPASNEYVVLKDFEPDARFPFGGLVKVGDKLYGTLSGYLFSYKPSTNTFIKYAVPGDIQTGVVNASDGKIYGTTINGLIYSFDPASATIQAQVLAEVATSRGNFIQASSGLLYGMSQSGGDNTNGSIYTLDIAANQFSTIHSFNGTDGAGPWGSLMQAANGILYGMTNEGGQFGKGVIFSVDPTNNEYSVLLNFDATNGDGPKGSLMQASDGKLYGVTRRGGLFGKGNIFRYDINSGSIVTIKSLNEFDGIEPLSTLTQGTNGELYGTTEQGPSQFGMGTIFSIDPLTNVYTLRAHFGPLNGSGPMGSFAKTNSGGLAAMSAVGGIFGAGAIFSINTSDNSFSKVHDFDDLDGATPLGDVVQASDGLLYGMTNSGGSSKRGTVFSINPNTHSLTTLLNFDKMNGQFPSGSLIQAANGILYGLTSSGGPYAGQPGAGDGYGTLFSFNPATNTHSILHAFNASEAFPFGSLLQAGNGKLYGITDGASSLFSFDIQSNVFIKLYAFSNSSLSSTRGSLIQASDGKLYGVAGDGGPQNNGAIFSFDISSNTFQVVHAFDGTNGRSPQGSLVQATDGKLYGMTNEGGANNLGVLYSYDLSGVFTKESDFDGTNGGNPFGSLIDPAAPSCPGFLVNIDDINDAVPGIDSNTIYLGYPLFSTATLHAKVSGGQKPYSYLWSTGATSDSINISPLVPTYYTVTVTDANLCKRTARIFINVIDVRCSDNKVTVCHVPHTGMSQEICIDQSAVAAHLAQGCHLGSCNLITARRPSSENYTEQAHGFGFTIAPNPSSTSFNLKMGSTNITQNAILRVVDAYGRVIDVRKNLFPNQVLQLGDAYAQGVYIAELIQGSTRTCVKLVKTK